MFPLRDSIRAERRPLVTWLLLAACVVVQVHLTSLGTGDPEALQRFAERYGLIPARVRFGAAHLELLLDTPWPWVRDVALPFFTSPFVHGGIPHLLGNCWFLFVFGDNVEGRLGHGRYLLFWFACASVAALLHVAMIPAEAPTVWSGFLERNALLDVPMVGASGAIAGVLGAYLVLFPRARVTTFVPPFFVFELPALLFLGLWFVLQFFAARATSLVGAIGVGVAYWAHVGGFAAGLLLGLGARRRVEPRPGSDRTG